MVTNRQRKNRKHKALSPAYASGFAMTSRPRLLCRRPKNSKITKDDLGATITLRAPVEFGDLVGERLDLGMRRALNFGHHEPDVERGLSSFGGNAQHIVHFRRHAAALDRLRASRKIFDELFQLRTRWDGNDLWRAARDLRSWQIELIGVFHVQHLPPEAGEFRQVGELVEACAGSEN